MPKPRGLTISNRESFRISPNPISESRSVYSLQEIEESSDRKGLFENDPDYSNESAYRTSHALPNHRIGIVGLITHANKSHIWEHIKKNPGKCIQGVIQLAAGILLTAIPGLGFIT